MQTMFSRGLQPVLVWGLQASVLQWTSSPTHQRYLPRLFHFSDADYSSNRKTCTRSICAVPIWMATRSITKHCVTSLIAIDGDTKHCVTSLIALIACWLGTKFMTWWLWAETTVLSWWLAIWYGDKLRQKNCLASTLHLHAMLWSKSTVGKEEWNRQTGGYTNI